MRIKSGAPRDKLKKLLFTVAKIQGQLDCMALCHTDIAPILKTLETQAGQLVKDINAALTL